MSVMVLTLSICVMVFFVAMNVVVVAFESAGDATAGRTSKAVPGGVGGHLSSISRLMGVLGVLNGLFISIALAVLS